MGRILNDMQSFYSILRESSGGKTVRRCPYLAFSGHFHIGSIDQMVGASFKVLLRQSKQYSRQLEVLKTCRLCAARIRFRFLSRMDQAQGTVAPALVANLWRVLMSFFNPAGGRGTDTTARTRTCPPTVEPRPARPPPSATPTVTATCTTSRTRTAMTTSTTPNADGTEVRKGVRARIFNI